MNNREKVIKGLECHLEGCFCGCCPYKAGEDSDSTYDCKYDMMLDAFTMLKAQEPVKPILDSRAIEFYRCGQCNEPIDRCDNYCWSCGMAVKWK